MQAQNFKFKEFQLEAIRALNHDRHVICQSATGTGKSQIFIERLKQYGEKLLIVVPLKSLERQHVLNLQKLGFKRRGDFEVLNPERLARNRFEPGLFVVDECHAVHDWGKSFRPAFRLIPSWLAQSQIKKSLWLSATLSPAHKQALTTELPLPQKWLGEFRLPSQLQVRALQIGVQERLDWLLYYLGRNSGYLGRDNGSGLIFVTKREWADRISRFLVSQNIEAKAYHAGLSLEERQSIEGQLRIGGVRVVVGTSALGMGLDVSSLDWVILFEPPHSMTDLAQMIGRVGRSQRSGQAWVLYDSLDLNRLQITPERIEVLNFLRTSQNFQRDLENWFH